MHLVFTKGSGKFDWMDVHVEGQAPSRVQCPKQRIIPHDMVHCAVEHTLQVRDFVGHINQGEAPGLGMQPEAQSDAAERLVEVFQGDEWSAGNTCAADMIAMYRVTCDARGCPALPVDKAAILAVRAQIAELTKLWQATPIDATMAMVL